ALIIVFATVTSLVQLVVPNELRGRVMSIYILAFRGGMPLGSLVSGYFASKIGAPVVLICNGILLVAVATYFLIRSHGVRELSLLWQPFCFTKQVLNWINARKRNRY